MLQPILKLTHWIAIAFVFALLLGFLAIRDSSSATQNIWVTDSMERIERDRRPEDTTNIHLFAARGEYEGFQIAINTAKDDLTVTDVRVSDFHGSGNHSIARNNITLYREHYVNITKPSPTWGGATIKPLGKGWYPDGLIPFVDPQTGAELANAKLDAIPFKLEAGVNLPIWVDVFVPRNVQPGDYRGTYTVTSNQGDFSGEILLTVWNFELPLKPSLKSAFLSWKQQDKNTYIELLKHKVMPVGKIDPVDQRELIDQWGLTSLRLPFWSGADFQNCAMKSAPSAAEIREQGKLHELDLLLYVYPTDEIDHCENSEPFKEWAINIHQAGVKHLAVMSPIPEFYDLVDIWVVNPRRYKEAKKRILEVIRQGKEVWFYTHHAPGGSVPNWQIDFKPINFRIPQGFINQSLGLTGLLYWRVDGWTNDPWNDVDTAPHPTEPKNYPGEGMLIYPGEQVGVKGSVPSMRLKWIREGVEDYEYIEILKRWGYEEWAMKTVSQVATDMHHWNSDPAVLNAARKKLGEKIHQLAS